MFADGHQTLIREWVTTSFTMGQIHATHTFGIMTGLNVDVLLGIDLLARLQIGIPPPPPGSSHRPPTIAALPIPPVMPRDTQPSTSDCSSPLPISWLHTPPKCLVYGHQSDPTERPTTGSPITPVSPSATNVPVVEPYNRSPGGLVLPRPPIEDSRSSGRAAPAPPTELTGATPGLSEHPDRPTNRPQGPIDIPGPTFKVRVPGYILNIPARIPTTSRRYRVRVPGGHWIIRWNTARQISMIRFRADPKERE